MNSKFVYEIPTKVYFGENQLENLGKELSAYGTKVLLVYGGGSIKKTGLYDEIQKEIKKEGLECYELSGVEPNPRISSVKAGAEICREKGIDVLLAVGGGSVIDCTKFIGAATYYEGDAWELLEKKPDIETCIPVISILTLSATGSEMDTCGVISNPDTKDKVGHRAPVMRPKVSFLDPTATYSVSRYQTACGSADILSHIMEEYFSMDGDLYMLDCMMEGMMKTVVRYAPVAIEDPQNYEARANLMWASSWAINGFIKGANTHAWSCHPMEHELSAYYDITHGLGLAILTPRWMEYCLKEENVEKYYTFAVNVFGIDKNTEKMEAAKQGIRCLEQFLFETLGLDRTLSDIGINEENFKIMAEKAARRTGTSFVPLTAKDIEKIYEMCL